MAISTYAELQAAIAQYLGRSDLTSIIPNFISMAEARMNRELRLRFMEADETITVAGGSESFPLPVDRSPGSWDVFLELRDIALAGDPPQPLSYVTPAQYRRMASYTGAPTTYSIIGDRVYLSPVPDADTDILLSYFREIPALDATIQTTSTMLTRHPDLYLYGSLLESIPYTRSSAPAELWQSYYNAAKILLEKSDQQGRFTAQLAMRPPMMRRF